MKRKRNCVEPMQDFGPMMGIKNGTLPKNEEIGISGISKNESNIICAPYSASGMAWFTDHGLNRHGSTNTDFLNPHNIGKGPTLNRFRSYLLSNLGMPIDHNPLQRKPFYNVTFSILSSKDDDRRFDFTVQSQAVQAALGKEVQVNSFAMWNYTVHQQIQIASQSAVFISIGGGGTAPAFFLPQGASLIVYGKENERMDWDLWNNYARIRVHWMSTKHMDADTKLLVDLIQDELESLPDLM
eukprot:CAMPEP_0178904616 /NCGR_PEP_ID=MMETSP0786-20121207/5799_1 /TAXON_ID=186022 /ORGANISM="Thalassionema frauenfeldii, Strain CCMP 1798" /LENGTH=240 /DNA_ID=CAMNT_0020576093 /DNA_START=373 /DNA_END=1095 /DNA_ORIENTATION=-